MSVPPRSVFAAAARQEVETHVEWDAPHCFQTLHLAGDDLTCRTMACIMVKYRGFHVSVVLDVCGRLRGQTLN